MLFKVQLENLALITWGDIFSLLDISASLFNFKNRKSIWIFILVIWRGTHTEKPLKQTFRTIVVHWNFPQNEWNGFKSEWVTELVSNALPCNSLVGVAVTFHFWHSYFSSQTLLILKGKYSTLVLQQQSETACSGSFILSCNPKIYSKISAFPAVGKDLQIRWFLR